MAVGTNNLRRNTQTKLTKCNFCRYFVGKQCSATGPTGRVNDYYCKDALFEFYAWLKTQKKGK